MSGASRSQVGTGSAGPAARRRRSPRRRWMVITAALVSLVWVVGCSPLGYYTQAVVGGATILAKRRAIEKVLERGELSAEQREKLQAVLDIRRFAIERLALPDNRSYRTYVATGRQVVTWNVVAAPRLSVEPVTWCFPIAGCVSYRGYFHEQPARRFAERLAARGFDVAVNGATAYSTLGWFADPVLDTFLQYPEWRLAGLIFHELAHQVVYEPGDTTFNESFASTVEELGTELWLEEQGRGDELEGARRTLEEESRFQHLMLRYRTCLAAAYATGGDDEKRLGRKSELLADLHDELGVLRRDGELGAQYDGWLSGRPINNADLASIGDYAARVPAFRALYEKTGGFPAFYREVERLKELPLEQRQAELDALAPAPAREDPRCPAPPDAP